jgi:hypothetical protein
MVTQQDTRNTVTRYLFPFSNELQSAEARVPLLADDDVVVNDNAKRLGDFIPEAHECEF